MKGGMVSLLRVSAHYLVCMVEFYLRLQFMIGDLSAYSTATEMGKGVLMTNRLQIGMTLYHLNRQKGTITEAMVISKSKNQVELMLGEELLGHEQLTLPSTHIGEWLFFHKDDAAATTESIAQRDEYRIYGNVMLEKAYNEFIKNAELAQQKTDLLHKLKENYDFEGFHHYTDFHNFISIMTEGYLYSRIRATQDRLITDSADQRVLKGTSEEYKRYARFFYRPKTPTLHSNEGIKKRGYKDYIHMPIPVLLLFDENIIFKDNVLFLDGGGGSSLTESTSCATQASSFDWGSIFGTDSYSRLDYYSNEEKNKRNAEFLCYEKVSIEHLKKIIFRAQPDLHRAQLILGENELFEIDPDKFINKGNYLKNFVIVPMQPPHENFFIVVGVFNNDPKEYTHTLLITYENGDSETLDSDPVLVENNFIAYLVSHKAVRIEYLMNGHQSAMWEAGT